MTADFNELLRVLLEQVVTLERKSGADQRAVRFSLRRNVDTLAIYERSSVLDRRENFGTRETSNDSRDKLAVAHGCNRYGVLRKSMKKVRRSIERIDDECQTRSSNFGGWRKLLTNDDRIGEMRF